MKIQLEQAGIVLFESALFRTVTTLVIGQDYLLLVDPNWLPREVDFISTYLQPYQKGRTCYLLFTHSDYDHIIGYGKFKGFQTIASKNFVENPKQAEILQEMADFDDQYYITRDYPIQYPEINHIIDAENQLQLGEDMYQFHQAVGHNSDGIIAHNLSRQMLIVGDYLSNIEFPYIYESVAEYKKTLDVLERIIRTNDIKLFITGHGDATREKSEMYQRIKDARTYIKHLENSVQIEEEFDTDLLFPRYQFPKIMSQFHEANLTLARKELLQNQS